MTSNPPISFAAKAKSAGNPASGGYPYTLSGTDLDQNFTFATSAYDKDHFNVTNTMGSGAHAQREVKLMVPIEAGTAAGQFAVWSGTTWTPSIAPPTTGNRVLGAVEGELLWKEDIPTAPSSGTHVLGVKDGTLQWIATEEC